MDVSALGVLFVFRQYLMSDISVKSLFQSRTSTLWSLGDERQYSARERVVTESASRENINIARGGLEYRKDDKEW